VKSSPDIRLAGLAAVRITWILAIAISVLAILSGLLFGTDSRDSSQQVPGSEFADGGDTSQQLPEFALFDPAAPLLSAGKTKTAAPHDDRSQRAKEEASGDGHPNFGVPDRSGSKSQPNDPRGSGPVVTPRSDPPQAASVTRPTSSQTPSVSQVGLPQTPSVSQPDLPQAPSVSQPDLPQAPSVTAVASQAPVSVSVSTAVETQVTVADNSVGLP
jgi:hypothetical protein